MTEVDTSDRDHVISNVACITKWVICMSEKNLGESRVTPLRQNEIEAKWQDLYGLCASVSLPKQAVVNKNEKQIYNIILGT